MSVMITPTLDATRLQQLAEIEDEGVDLMAELVGLFVAETETLLGDAARLTEDAGALQRVAHTLVGTCGTIGAARMRILAMELESTLKRGEVAPAGSIVHSLAEEFVQVGVLLEQYLHHRDEAPGRPGN